MANSLTWTSSTASSTANQVAMPGQNSVTVTVTPSGTVSAGTITFEATTDDINWSAVELFPLAGGAGATTSSLTASSSWYVNGLSGYYAFRARLSTVITGSGSALVVVGTATGNASGTGSSPGGAAGGDLSGSYPNPTVSAITGVAVSGTPTNGQTIVASSGTAAAWASGSSSGVSSFNTRTGAVTLAAADVEGLYTAAGQLFVGTGSGTGALLANGTAGQALVANTSAAPSWQAVLNGPLTGDVTTSGNAASVVQIQGNAITSGQAATLISLAKCATPAGFTPSNPSSTTSTSAVMMGLGSTIAYTPTSTGNLEIILTGYTGTATAVTNSTVRPYYGTGVAPSNGGAVAGTALAAAVTVRSPTAGVDGVPFTCVARVTGLSVNTAIWVDVSLFTGTTADAASVAGVQCLIRETL